MIVLKVLASILLVIAVAAVLLWWLGAMADVMLGGGKGSQ